MRNERSDPTDALIDNAARQMIAGEPSASLRRAVRERIEQRRSPWLLSPAIAGVAAVVVIAAVLVGRTLSGPADAPGERGNVRPTIERAGIPVPQPSEVVEPGGIRSVGLPWPAEARDERRRQADADRRRPTRRLADDLTVLPEEEEPMIPPIVLEPLVTVQIAIANPIAVESPGVMPIEIEPLQIEPLRGIE